jgi:hypothetical protein
MLCRMSALDQKRTSAHVGVMSALPPKADMKRTQAVSGVHCLFLADLFPSSVIHPCPLYAQKRTLELSRGMSALSPLDHFVGSSRTQSTIDGPLDLPDRG